MNPEIEENNQANKAKTVMLLLESYGASAINRKNNICQQQEIESLLIPYATN